MRSALSGCGTIIGLWGVLGMSIFIGFKYESFVVFFLCLIAGGILASLLGQLFNEAGRINMESWLASVMHCEYKYAWDGSGIAIDVKNKILHLTSHIDGRHISKSYSLPEDVREWGYEMPGMTITTPGRGASLGDAAGIQAVNSMESVKAIENTGLWVRVKDIDFPKWFIKFKCKKVQDKECEMQLTRWMEIISQHVND